MSAPPRIATALVIVTACALVVWLRPGSHTPGRDAPPAATATPPPTSTGGSPAPEPTIDTSNTDPRFTRFTDGTVHLSAPIEASRQLHQSDDPRADLGIIEQLVGDYRTLFQENPVGTENTEIIAQLLGENPKNVVFLAPDLDALDSRGRLLDRWGSPYIFHPLRADLMDVRSIGPDKKPWTDDDLTLGLEDAEAELQLRP